MIPQDFFYFTIDFPRFESFLVAVVNSCFSEDSNFINLETIANQLYKHCCFTYSSQHPVNNIWDSKGCQLRAWTFSLWPVIVRPTLPSLCKWFFFCEIIHQINIQLQFSQLTISQRSTDWSTDPLANKWLKRRGNWIR